IANLMLEWAAIYFTSEGIESTNIPVAIPPAA
ncbi:unnamed protein product, partial [marine sediment metagenome]